MPGAGFVYALPQGPALFQPDDWPHRVEEAGAVTFAATADRGETLENLLDALRAKGRDGPLLGLPDDRVRPFLALGFGYLLVESLFDAMDHDHLLDVPAFWADVAAAVEAAGRPDGGEDVRARLRAAAEQLPTGPRAADARLHLLARLVHPRPREPGRRLARLAGGGPAAHAARLRRDAGTLSGRRPPSGSPS